MAIKYFKKSVTLEGAIPADDAEGFASWLRDNPKAVVNLRQCAHVHASVLQVLLALRPRIRSWPTDAWLARALGAQ